MRLFATQCLPAYPRITTREKLKELSRHAILAVLKFLDTLQCGENQAITDLNGRFTWRPTCLLSCEYVKHNLLISFAMNVL